MKKTYYSPALELFELIPVDDVIFLSPEPPTPSEDERWSPFL